MERHIEIFDSEYPTIKNNIMNGANITGISGIQVYGDQFTQPTIQNNTIAFFDEGIYLDIGLLSKPKPTIKNNILYKNKTTENLVGEEASITYNDIYNISNSGAPQDSCIPTPIMPRHLWAGCCP